MLTEVKLRMGIPAAVTVYDSEISSLISAALLDLKAAGVPAWLLEDENPDHRTLAAVTAFTQAYHLTDRTDTEKYKRIYNAWAFRLMLEPEIAPAQTEG